MSNTEAIAINYDLNAQRTEATVEVAGTRFVVSTEQLEDVISRLGGLRSQMAPEVPAAPNQNKIFPADLFDITRLGATTEKGAAIRFRSVLFGWFEIYLAPEWCSGLIAYLQGGNPAAPADSQVKH